MEFVGNLIVLFAAIFAVLERKTIDPGTTGLSISYAMQVIIIFNRNYIFCIITFTTWKI